MKCILADDHILFRDGIVLLLQQHEPEIECLACGSVDEALALLQRHPETDLLLLDLNMPGMQGARSVEALRHSHGGLPVVILSGDESRAQMEALLAAGASGYIPKSSSAPLMMSAIRLVMSGGVFVPQQMLGASPAAAQGVHLTDRQTDVLRLLVLGKPNKLISRELSMSEGTVKSHINAIYRSLDVANRTEAASVAQRLHLLDR